MRNDNNDFTEDEYRRLIVKAKNKASFISFSEYLNNKPAQLSKRVIWRHDIDFSVHRSLRLGEIEAEEGVKSVFFVLFSGDFYNVFEAKIVDKLRKLVALGHEIGIHLDVGLYSEIPSIEQIEKDLLFLSGNLEYLLGVTPITFSFHNPTPEFINTFTGEYIGRFINAYSNRIMHNIAYCSDSNGYWRFQSIDDFLDRDDYDTACILTHPAWWTPNVLSPRERIQRAIDGRGKNVGDNYDNLLEQFHRENIR